jgi:hypothetical protein
MDPVVTVDADTVSVEPGGQASVTVRVRNLSSIVEGFRLDVLGEASGWARILPDHVQVLPQGEAMATVLFNPPSGVNTRAGQVPFGVRVVSQVDAGASAVAEGDLQVGNVSLNQAKITPVTSRGRFSARHRVEFANWGNTPVRLRLEAADPDDALGFLVAPEILDLPLGVSRSARVKVRARKPFFRGTPLRRTFRVVGRPLEAGRFDPAPGPSPQPYGYDPTQPAVDGAFEQKAIVGRGLVPLLVLAVVAAGAIGYLTSRPEKNPADESVAPPPVANLEAAPISHDAVRLTWDPGERIDEYTVLTIDPETADQPDPRVIDSQRGPSGVQAQFDVAKLKAGTRYCFQIVAQRGDAKSVPTTPQCVTTPRVDAPDAPEVPIDVNVRVDGENALITWGDPSGGKADHIIRRGTDTIVETVDHPKNEVRVPIVEGELCYTVEASLGGAVSKPSAPKCLPDGTTADGTTPGSGGDPENPGIIAVADNAFFPAEDLDPQGRANDLRDELAAKGVKAQVLLSSEFPNMTPVVTKVSYMVYVAGFPNTDVALTYCQKNVAPKCSTFLTGPRQPVAPTGGAASTTTGP